MLIEGKMSTGVRSRATGAIRRSRSEKTTNVYGRLRASFTIHMSKPLRGSSSFLRGIAALCEARRIDAGRRVSSRPKISDLVSSASSVGLFVVGRYVISSVKPVAISGRSRRELTLPTDPEERCVEQDQN